MICKMREREREEHKKTHNPHVTYCTMLHLFVHFKVPIHKSKLQYPREGVWRPTLLPGHRFPWEACDHEVTKHLLAMLEGSEARDG